MLKKDAIIAEMDQWLEESNATKKPKQNQQQHWSSMMPPNMPQSVLDILGCEDPFNGSGLEDAIKKVKAALK